MDGIQEPRARMIYCPCGAGPFGGNYGLEKHKRNCAIVEQQRRDAKLRAVQVKTSSAEGQAPASPVPSGGYAPVAISMDPGASSGENLEAVANKVISMKGKRLCKCGAGPFDGPTGLARHMFRCPIAEQQRRDARLRSVQVHPSSAEKALIQLARRKKWEVLLRRDVRGSSEIGEVVLRGTVVEPGSSRGFSELFLNYDDLSEIERVIHEFLAKKKV